MPGHPKRNRDNHEDAGPDQRKKGASDMIALGRTEQRYGHDRNIRLAFTLIELLVVIAIISLLVSILLPSLRMAKEMARRVVCAANLKGVGLTIIMYAGDNELWPPFAVFDKTDPTKNRRLGKN